jgi:hypothetical protein
MSETIPRLIADGGQSNAEVVINDNAKSLGAVLMYAKHPPSCSALVWGMYGGNWAGSTIGTLYSSTQTYHDTETLTDSTTNYLVAHRTTGAITTATNTTNWNDTGVYGRLHKLTTSGGAVTAAEDWRFLTGGIFDFGAAPSGTVAAGDVNITDTGAYYTGTEVETALQEIGASLAAKASTSYVDAAVAGLSWKQAVRAATTVAGTLASDFESGDTIDGVVLATGNRILVKNQAAPAENGIYVVAASGAPTRATDADSGAELVNASVYVSEGTTLADTQWTCTTNATITVGATSLAFAQLTSGGAMATDALWDAAGDLAYGTGSNTGARLAIGTARQVLLVNAGATAPEWGAVDSDDVAYAATTVADWNGSADPGDVEQALDQLAERVKDIELAGGGGTQGLHDVWLPAGSWYADITSPPLWNDIDGASNQPDWKGWGFDPSTAQRVWTLVALPKSYNGGTFTFDVYWRAGTASNDAVWGMRAVFLADNVALPTNYGTAVTVTDTVANTDRVLISPTSAALTPGGSYVARCALFIELYRDAADGGDTNTGTVQMLGAMLHITTNADTDA